MNRWQRALALTLAHLAIVCSLGAKLLIDRARLPRVWAKAVPYDPDLPIRGRYLSMRLEVEARPQPHDCQENKWKDQANPPKEHTYRIGVSRNAKLAVVDGKLTAIADEEGSLQYQWPCPSPPEEEPAWNRTRTQATQPFLLEPTPYFIPEHADDPTRRPAGEELWVEVTVPRKGPPRPIQLGVKKNGQITPLDLH